VNCIQSSDAKGEAEAACWRLGSVPGSETAPIKAAHRHRRYDALLFYIGQNAEAAADKRRLVGNNETTGWRAWTDCDFKWTEAGSNRRHMDFQSDVARSLGVG
jgi:hypothetical protein